MPIYKGYNFESIGVVSPGVAWTGDTLTNEAANGFATVSGLADGQITQFIAQKHYSTLPVGYEGFRLLGINFLVDITNDIGLSSADVSSYLTFDGGVTAASATYINTGYAHKTTSSPTLIRNEPNGFLWGLSGETLRAILSDKLFGVVLAFRQISGGTVNLRIMKTQIYAYYGIIEGNTFRNRNWNRTRLLWDVR